VRVLGILGVALAGAMLVVGLTWALEHVMPSPYSSLLAVAIVAVTATEVIKRRPRQRAERMLRRYFAARERGADEATARARLMTRL